MVKACLEVEVLRVLGPRHARQRALHKLCRKYAKGWRSAHQVVLGLEALRAQNDTECLPELAAGALFALDPVPTVLWLWLCRRADSLGVNTLRHMLKVAAKDPRCEKHLRAHMKQLTLTPDGLVALVHDSHRLPWGPDLARPAIADFLARYSL